MIIDLDSTQKSNRADDVADSSFPDLRKNDEDMDTAVDKEISKGKS